MRLQAWLYCRRRRAVDEPGTGEAGRLDDRKGAIRPGYDADLVIWDRDAQVTVAAATLQQRHKITPYDGCRLRGAVQATYVHGVRVWSDGKLDSPGCGQLL